MYACLLVPANRNYCLCNMHRGVAHFSSWAWLILGLKNTYSIFVTTEKGGLVVRANGVGAKEKE